VRTLCVFFACCFLALPSPVHRAPSFSFSSASRPSSPPLPSPSFPLLPSSVSSFFPTLPLPSSSTSLRPLLSDFPYLHLPPSFPLPILFSFGNVRPPALLFLHLPHPPFLAYFPLPPQVCPSGFLSFWGLQSFFPYSIGFFDFSWRRGLGISFSLTFYGLIRSFPF